MSDISVPGFGKQKKQTVYVIGGIVVAVIGIGYYRSKKNAAATAAATTATTDTSSTGTTDTSAIDPTTGLPYAYDSSAYGSGYIDPTTGLPLDNVPSAGPTGFTSNSQWSQAAEEYLAGTVGLDATSVQAALGKYITGGNVTADQQNIIEQAIAAEGYPPQSGPNGYPPSIKLTATVPPTQTPSGPVAGSPKYGTPISGTYIRNIATGAVYQVDTTNHVIYHITATTWQRLAKEKQLPPVTNVLPSDARLKYTNGGNI